MSFYGFLAFCAIYTLAVAAPGPGVAAVLARSLAHGTRDAPAFIAGFLMGDLVWLTLAATGLAALAQTAQAALLVIKYGGALYLLYLAYKLWTAPARPLEAGPASSGEKPTRVFLGSLALTLGNPKPIAFFLALLPTVIDLETLSIAGFLEIIAAMAIILPVVLGIYALAAARARRFFKSARSVRIINRSTGAVMAGAAVAVATR
jgi:threonine/homoserine/homoserine lactone efflux protein